MKPEIIIGGERLTAVMPWGGLEWVTCWPGGTETITFEVARGHRLFRPDALVSVDYGGLILANGLLKESTRGEPLRAEGLHRKGEDYAALTAGGETSVDTDDSVNRARVRGLPWAAQAPIPSAVPSLADDQIRSVSQLLDHKAKTVGLNWGVGTDQVPFIADWEPASLHMLPGIEGLGISQEGYASRLFGRFFNSATSTYWTASATDDEAANRWGLVEHTITEPLGGDAPMTLAQAQAILLGLLDQGRAQIGWSTPIEAQFGDVVTEFGRPVDLKRIHARQTIKLHGLDKDIADLRGGTTADLRIARTRHSGDSVTIEPVGLSSPMTDALANIPAA